MTVYFKATRPDGTDFYSGTVRYAVGKRVRPLPFEGKRKLCGEGVLHASDVPAETLVGRRWWPCRLFEVTGIPFASKGHKHGFRQLSIVREVDAHLALGLNGREVAALIDRAGRLTLEESKALDAARGDVTVAARDAAWYAARDGAGGAARAAAWYAAWYAARHAARHAARDAAWYAAGDAAMALVVRDLITPEHFDTLCGPWRDVIG
jgi:hypothetical protein